MHAGFGPMIFVHNRQNKGKKEFIMKKLAALSMMGVMIASSVMPTFAAEGGRAYTGYNPYQTVSSSDWYSNANNWYSEWQKYWQNKGNDTSNSAVSLATPVVTKAKYTHNTPYYGSHPNMDVQWNVVDGAESYEVEITGADGTVNTYTVTSNRFYSQKIDCPKTYNKKTSVWSASVRVRAIAGNKTSNWSESYGVSCDSIHSTSSTSQTEKLSKPVVTKAKYTHNAPYYGSHKNLDIDWDEVEGAEKYEVKITKGDGTELNYTVSSNDLYIKDGECPKVYNEKTHTWESATVTVRAVSEKASSEWSDSVNISCDSLHSR